VTLCNVENSISTYDSSDILRCLVPGRLDTRARWLYMNGHCHLLAVALAKRLEVGVSVVCLGEREAWVEADEEEFARGIRRNWIHALARVGRGRYLDVMGVHGENEVLETWRGWTRSGLHLVDVSADELLVAAYWGAEPDPGDLVLAGALVTPLLERCGINPRSGVGCTESAPRDGTHSV
jgi:hypothetical protein